MVSGQSRMSRQDNSQSTMLQWFDELYKQHRIDSEAERAHRRDMVTLNLMLSVHKDLQRATIRAPAILDACNSGRLKSVLHRTYSMRMCTRYAPDLTEFDPCHKQL